MNKYLIQYKVATVAELPEKFDFKGYTFESYDTQEWWSCDAWLVSKQIEAETAGKARYEFITKLIPEIEKCAVISQCAFRMVANSYFIYKLNNNSDRIIYIYYVRDSGHTGLHFDIEEIEQLPKLEGMKNEKGLLYINDAANATTVYTRLTMLLSAAEAFAGEIKTRNGVSTNKIELRKILGDVLYEKMYKYNGGVRNKLVHGKIDSKDITDNTVEDIYKRLLRFLREDYGVSFNEDVVHPQRNFYGNFEFASTGETIKDEKYLDLRFIEQAFDDNNPEKHALYSQIFGEYKSIPKDY